MSSPPTSGNSILDQILEQNRQRNLVMPLAPPIPYTPDPNAQVGFPAPPQLAPPPAPPNPILGAIAAAISTAGNALSTPQGLVQKGLGDIGATFRGGPGGQEGFRNFRDEFATAIEQADPAIAANAPAGIGSILDAANRMSGDAKLGNKAAATAFRVGSELATDPLTYVGAGIPAKLAEVALTRNASPALVNFLTQLSRGESLTQEALNLPFKGIAAGAKTVAKIPHTGLGQTVIDQSGPNTISRPAESLYDLLSNRSKESVLHNISRDLIDAWTHIRQGGGGLAETAMLKRRRLADYQDPLEAEKTIMAMEHGVVNFAGQISDPRVRIAALDAISTGHAIMARELEQTAAKYHDARMSGMSQPDLQQLAYDLDQEWYDSSLHAWHSVQDTVSSLAERASKLGGITPHGQSGTHQVGVQQAQAYLNNRISSFWGNFGTTFQSQPSLPEFLRGRQTLASDIGRDIGTQTAKLRNDLSLGGTTPFAAPADVTLQVNQRFDSYKNATAQFRHFINLVPTELRQSIGIHMGDFLTEYNKIRADRARVEKAVKEAWDNRMTGQPFPAIDQAHPVESISSIMQQMGLSGIQNTHDLVEKRLLFGQATAGTLASLETAIKNHPAGDLLRTAPEELAVDKVVRRIGGTLGLSETSNPIKRALSTATALWKETALATANYPLQNITSQLVMGGLKGVNPLRVLREYKGNLLKIGKGEYTGTTANRNFASTYGEGLGEASRQSSGLLNETQGVRNFLKKGITASAKVGSLRLGAGGAALGGLSGNIETPADASPLERTGNILRGAAEGGAFGAALPRVSRVLLHNIGGAIETIGREAAGIQGATKYMSEQGTTLVNIADRALAHTVPGVQTVARNVPQPLVYMRHTVHSPSAGNIATARTEIASRAANNAAISPDELFTILQHAGVDEGRALDASTAWRDVVHAAIKEGEKFSNTIHFDYGNLNNLEQFIKTFVPFSTWATKAIPFFAEEMAKHPVILQSLLAINKESQRDIKDQGLTQRFAGSLPVDWATPLWSVLVGHDATPWINPIRGLIPFSDTARSLGSGTNEDSPITQALQVAGATGMSLNPLIETGVRMSGITSSGKPSDTPAKGYIGQASRIQAIDAALGGNRGLGIDINAAPRALETMVRRAGGQDPTTLRTSLAARRLDEMALRDTGQNIRSGAPEVAAYVQAKTRQSGPLWDQAARDVQRESGTRSLLGYGFSTLSPQASLGAEESQIRGARVGLLISPEISTQLRALSISSPGSIAPAELVQAVAAASQQMADRNLNGQLPKVVADILTTAPTAKNLYWIANQITEAQANVDPSLQGYSGGGTPTEQQLSSLLTQYNNDAALLAGLPDSEVVGITRLAQMYQHPALKARGASGAQAIELKKLQSARDAFRAANPLLDQYLLYKQVQKGEGTPADFITNFYGKQALPPPAP